MKSSAWGMVREKLRPGCLLDISMDGERAVAYFALAAVEERRPETNRAEEILRWSE